MRTLAAMRSRLASPSSIARFGTAASAPRIMKRRGCDAEPAIRPSAGSEPSRMLGHVHAPTLSLRSTPSGPSVLRRLANQRRRIEPRCTCSPRCAPSAFSAGAHSCGALAWLGTWASGVGSLHQIHTCGMGCVAGNQCAAQLLPQLKGHVRLRRFASCTQYRECARMAPNPSIERTSNGGARLFAPSRSVAPLAAAHVKRWAP